MCCSNWKMTEYFLKWILHKQYKNRTSLDPVAEILWFIFGGSSAYTIEDLGNNCLGPLIFAAIFLCVARQQIKECASFRSFSEAFPPIRIVVFKLIVFTYFSNQFISG